LLPISTGMATAVLITIALLAGVRLGLMRKRLARVEQEQQLQTQRSATLEKELTVIRRQAAQADSDHQWFVARLREVPHLAHELHVEAGGRHVPRLLLGAAVRMLESRKAVVLVRRRPSASDPERHLRLAVAAVSPSGLVELGTEVSIGRGEIGYAAENLSLMDRKDFDNQPPPVRNHLRDETPQALQFDVVVPMVINEELVGVLAVAGMKRKPAEVKDLLRLLAQLGAASMHAQAQYSEMKVTASLDGLTGIYNKRFLTERLPDEIRRAVDGSSPLAIFMFDLDNFKHYNDSNGHVAGDRLLQTLARLVRDNVRKDAIFGRYGGEEFLLVFANTTRSQALAAAENVRQAIAAHEFPFGSGQPLGLLSISGGVAECPLDGADTASLLRAADEALYEAKRAGRNRVLSYRPRYLGEDEAQEPLTAEQKEALERRALGERSRIDRPGEPVALPTESVAIPQDSRVGERGPETR
jgi:diguanylate cyclase (GGDEF)-like protein